MRDPRDLLVSLLQSLMYSHPTSADSAGLSLNDERRRLLRMNSDEVRLESLISGFASMRDWYASWSSGGDASARLIRYEDLLVDQIGVFSETVKWLGWRVPSETLASVVHQLSFKQRSGRNPGDVDKFSHYRKGTSGDWRNFFNCRLGRLFEEMYPGLLVLTGYEAGVDWWRLLPERTAASEVASDNHSDRSIAELAQMVEVLERRNALVEQQLVEKQTVINELSIAAHERLDIINSLQKQLLNPAPSGPIAGARPHPDGPAAHSDREPARDAVHVPASQTPDEAVLDPHFDGWSRADLVGSILAKERTIRELSGALSAYRTIARALLPLRATRRVSAYFWKAFRPRLGMLYQHAPRPMRRLPAHNAGSPDQKWPTIAIVTPSFQQGRYIEQTILSILDQNYPNVNYFVKDGGSTDETVSVVTRYGSRLSGWVCEQDGGQTEAINMGFAQVTGDIMAYLNSDDILLPGALASVATYFAEHPGVDVVYGDRLIIDEDGQEVGNWRLPPHNNTVLSWADYIPQETMFWRRSAWEKVGSRMDESFHFAMDWDLIVRFRDAGLRFAHIPRFLGAFRVHSSQKTSAAISTTGQLEMARLRTRALGFEPDHRQIRAAIAPYLFCHLLVDAPQRFTEVASAWNVRRRTTR
jgi:GT2 family glycosyltransferase